MSPIERVTADLRDVIERASAVFCTSGLPEPTSLPAARRKVQEKAARLRAAEAELDAVTQQLADYSARPVLRGLWGPTIDPNRQALQTRYEELQIKFQFARTYHVRAKGALEAEELKFQVNRTRHGAALATHKQQAEKQIALAQAALRFLKKNPRTAFWGAQYLMHVAAQVQKARSEWEMAPASDLPPDGALVDVLDIWGKPYGRRPA